MGCPRHRLSIEEGQTQGAVSLQRFNSKIAEEGIVLTYKILGKKT